MPMPPDGGAVLRRFLGRVGQGITCMQQAAALVTCLRRDTGTMGVKSGSRQTTQLMSPSPSTTLI